MNLKFVSYLLLAINIDQYTCTREREYLDCKPVPRRRTELICRELCAPKKRPTKKRECYKSCLPILPPCPPQVPPCPPPCPPPRPPPRPPLCPPKVSCQEVLAALNYLFASKSYEMRCIIRSRTQYLQNAIRETVLAVVAKTQDSIKENGKDSETEITRLLDRLNPAQVETIIQFSDKTNASALNGVKALVDETNSNIARIMKESGAGGGKPTNDSSTAPVRDNKDEDSDKNGSSVLQKLLQEMSNLYNKVANLLAELTKSQNTEVAGFLKNSNALNTSEIVKAVDLLNTGLLKDYNEGLGRFMFSLYDCVFKYAADLEFLLEQLFRQYSREVNQIVMNALSCREKGNEFGRSESKPLTDNDYPPIPWCKGQLYQGMSRPISENPFPENMTFVQQTATA